MTTIAFVAPSGAALEHERIDRAASQFGKRGWQVIAPDALWKVHQRFAGDDDARLASLHEVACDTDCDVVMALRGGYGMTRLLDRIDWKAVGRAARAGKLFVGHSDFTLFNLALLAKAHAISFAGPMASSDFGEAEPSKFTAKHFFDAITKPEIEISVRRAKQPKVDCAGTIWGGNLALVASLVGTPYLPKVDGGILFVEEIGEYPRRVERFLYQLMQAGVLQRQRALILGDFSDYTLGPNDNGYDIPVVVEQFRKLLGIPVVTGLPFGHIRDKVTIPVGARAKLKSTRGGYRLTISGHPTLRKD